MTMNEIAAVLFGYYGGYDEDNEDWDEPDEAFYAGNDYCCWARN